MRVFDGTSGMEHPLERSHASRLTSACKTRLIDAFQEFVRSRSDRSPLSAVCAVDAQGVTMRRLRLPKCSEAEIDKVLLLQIESEFPLPPDQLAWGVSEAPCPASGKSAEDGTEEVLVFAVRSDSLEDYAELLNAARIASTFTLAPFARRFLLPKSAPPNFSILHVAEPQCELACFEQGALASVRMIAKSGRAATAAGSEGSSDNPAAVAASEWDAVLKAALSKTSLGQALYVSSDQMDAESLSTSIAQSLGNATRCEALRVESGTGASAVTRGLEIAGRQSETARLPLFRTKAVESHSGANQSIPWKWIARAAALLLCILGLRYLQPALAKTHVEKKLVEMKIHRAVLPAYEKELGFLQHLAKNQAMVQDTIFVVAKAAPQGTRIESLSISRKGEISVRTTVSPPTQAVAFRSKLTDSGFFSTVVVEEQSPSQDRQKSTLRISASPKPGASRPALTAQLAPTAPKGSDPQKTAPSNAPAGKPATGTNVLAPISSTNQSKP